jgi:hypothetical protein
VSYQLMEQTLGRKEAITAPVSLNSFSLEIVASPSNPTNSKSVPGEWEQA